MKLIKDRESTIRSLELEVAKTKMTSRMNKKKVREELKWTGEETNFSETVSNFCRAFLFPRTKFLNDGWKDYLPDDRDSLYALCMRRLKIQRDQIRKIFGRELWCQQLCGNTNT